MINSEGIIYNLSKNAKKENYTFTRLYKILYNKDMYIKAISKVYKNHGSGTSGIDNETIDGINQDKIDALIEELKSEKYQPQPVRRVYIPKKDGKQRPLGIPNFKDRLVQEVCRVILDTIYEPTFLKHSHGFRENHSCHSALKEIEMSFTGVNWFIEGDIKGYFDNINHKVLIDILRKRIKDERFLRLIWKMLRAGYLENWKYNNTYSGTPQGGIISPLLANIYLHELDIFVIEELKKNFDKGKPRDKLRNPEYRSIEFKVGKCKKAIDQTENPEERLKLIKEYKELYKIKLNTPYYTVFNENVKALQYVRYADDFLIGVIGSKEDCRNLKLQIKNFLKEKLDLTLSEEKTLITNSKDGANFLGYYVKVNNEQSYRRRKDGTKRREFNKIIKIGIPKGTIEKFIVKNKYVKDIDAKQWEPIHKPFLTALSDLEILRTYDSEIRGFYNYYCLAENVSRKLWQLRYVVEYSCLKTFCNKYKCSIGKFKAKNSIEGKWGIEYSNQKGVQFARIIDSFPRKRKIENSNKFDNIRNNYIYQCTTELEARLKAEKCELCGKMKVPFNLHHIKKVKDLKGKERWEILMIAKKRKTLVVCNECHIEIHRRR